MVAPTQDQPRPVSRFPFRANDERERAEVNVRINTTLIGVERLLYRLAKQHLPNADRATREDAVQAARIHLWRHALPAFDAARGVKVSTFIHTVASNILRDEARRIGRAAKRRPERLVPEGRTARDEREDRTIECIADAVLKDPERYVSPRQAQALRAIAASAPGENREITALRAGMSRETLAATVYDARKRLGDRQPDPAAA